MLKTIINATQYSMLQEIERILELHPHHPYQQAFAHPDRQQQLVVWVLNRVPSLFIITDKTEEAIVHPNYAPYCSDQQSCLEYVIRQGIQEILAQNQEEIEHTIPIEEITGQAASHWFG
jgi:hypothetical protein